MLRCTVKAKQYTTNNNVAQRDVVSLNACAIAVSAAVYSYNRSWLFQNVYRLINVYTRVCPRESSLYLFSVPQIYLHYIGLKRNLWWIKSIE